MNDQHNSLHSKTAITKLSLKRDIPFTGLIIRWKMWGEISSDNFYNDQVLWELPRDVEDTSILMVQSMKWKKLGIFNGKIMPQI